MKSLALLILRLTVGGLLAGHGAQKLFGSFEGPGLEKAAGMIESLGFKPGRPWTVAASSAELGGGILTAMGLMSPLGPIAAMCAMVTAAIRAHGGKPIWVTAGGAELPLTNIAALAALTLAGPGAMSLDKILGIRLPAWFNLVAMGTAATITVNGINASLAAQQQVQPAAQVRAEAQAGRLSEPVSSD